MLGLRDFQDASTVMEQLACEVVLLAIEAGILDAIFACGKEPSQELPDLFFRRERSLIERAFARPRTLANRSDRETFTVDN